MQTHTLPNKRKARAELPPELASRRLLTVKEISAMLGVSYATTWNLLKEGKLPAPVKIGSSTRWRLADLDAFLEAQVQQAELETAGADTVLDNPPHARVARR